jgi:hypothetical protein
MQGAISSKSLWDVSYERLLKGMDQGESHERLKEILTEFNNHFSSVVQDFDKI